MSRRSYGSRTAILSGRTGWRLSRQSSAGVALRSLPQWESRAASDAELRSSIQPVTWISCAHVPSTGRHLDGCDTPSFRGCFEPRPRSWAPPCSRRRVLPATPARIRHIAGLHHAARDTAAGFCIFTIAAGSSEAAPRRHCQRGILDIDAHMVMAFSTRLNRTHS